MMRAGAVVSLGAAALALDNGVARTPPMGWSTWNAFHCNISGDQLTEVADALKSSGMVAAGYSTLNIDDCWPLRARDNKTGDIVPDPKKFPKGMRAFSDDIAERGLGLGIYTAHGALTCKHFPGSLGYEEQDAKIYASWNVKFVKNDWCWHHEGNKTKHLNAFNAMRDALNATGVPMVHSIHWSYGDTPGPDCAKGIDCPLPLTANMWRVGGDISPSWGAVLRLIDTAAEAPAAAGPGQWNDADMLEVGNGMTAEQDRAHFTMWCVLASPLIAGNDVRNMSKETIATLTNKHAIAVNQDPLGHQGTIVAGNGTDLQAWSKPLKGGAFAVAFLNRGNIAGTVELSFDALGAAKAYEGFDLWADGASVGVMKGSVAVKVNATAAAFYRLVPQ